ncbi:glycosyltransferase [Mucilaginibacter sp.]|uniref:glycosyltransferase n=1 Tax=Mucilaginibacter sp. TaxID=1882438 RepID=UPI0035BC0CB9
MISLIVCSIQPDLLQQLTENVAATVGVPYEIIATDNRNTGKGISQVYNEALVKAQYEILCFVHEDIIIQTQNWGRVLVNLFKDTSLGLVGVAGSSYRPLTPSAWVGIGPATVFNNIIQGYQYTVSPDTLIYANPKNQKLVNVVCVDGVWLSTTKKVASEILFDQETFKGFHFYDIDFSMSVVQKYKVAVTFEILIKHLSEGRYDSEWLKNSIKFSEKWQARLPLAIGNFSKSELIRGEKMTFKHFINQLLQFGFPIAEAYKALWRGKRFYTVYRGLFFKLNYYILIKYAFRSGKY